MSYDFRMVRTPRIVPPDYAPPYPDSPGDYRLTGSGMGTMLEVMYRAGVLDDETPAPDLSLAWPPEGLDPTRASSISAHIRTGEPIPPSVTASELAACHAALERLASLRATPPKAHHLVAAFKFCSNDEWLVTPPECAAIATGLQAAISTRAADLYPFEPAGGPSDEQFQAWLSGWIAFNRIASAHCGYTVA